MILRKELRPGITYLRPLALLGALIGLLLMNGPTQAAVVSADPTCTPITTTDWSAPLPIHASMTQAETACFTFTPAEAGTYVLRMATEGGILAVVTDETSVEVGSSVFPLSEIPMTPQTYTITVTASVAGTYAMGLFEVGETADCAPLPSTQWDAAATTLDFTAEPAAVHCREIAATSGDYVRIGHESAPALGTAKGIKHAVFDGEGVRTCSQSTWTDDAFNCQLTGTGPWHVLTWLEPGPGQAAAESAQFWVNSFAQTDGCAAGLDSTVSMIAARKAFPGRATPITCLLSNLAKDARARMDVRVLTEAPDPGALTPWDMVDSLGVVQCSGNASSPNPVPCALTGTGPFRVLLPGGDANVTYEAAAHRITKAAGCHVLDGIATGIPAQSGELSVEHPLSCYTFQGGLGDELAFSTPQTPGLYTFELFGPNGDRVMAIGDGYTYQLEGTGDHVVVVSLVGTDPVPFTVGASCLNPACGPGALSVLSATPDTVGAGDQVTVTLRGRALLANSVVELVKAGTIVPGTVAEAAPTGRRLDAQFDARGLSGTWSVRVTNPNTETATLPDAVNVVPVEKAKVVGSLVAPTRFVAGRTQTYTIVVQNQGNVDALNVPIVLQGLPKGTEVVPKFTMYAVNASGDVVEKDFPQDEIVYEGSDSAMFSMMLGRVGPGERRELPLAVTVNEAVDFAPTLRVGDCLMSSTEAAGTNLAAPKPDPDMPTPCGLAIVKTMVSFIPGYDCVTTTIKVLGDAYDAMNDWKTATTLTPLETGDVLGCVSSLLPGGNVLSFMYDMVGAAVNGANIAAECIPPLPPGPTINSVQSADPNEMVGPLGGGEHRAITGSGKQTYAVYFENKADATAPAQEVTIADQLDPAVFDLDTVRFTGIWFGEYRYDLSAPAASVDDVIDLATVDGQQVQVRTEVTNLGLVTWTLKTLDPVTGNLPEDPLIGFLPPNVDGTEGQGAVTYEVALKSPADGATVRNGATIVFDLNAPIATNEWTNLIDRTAPTAGVTSPSTATGPFQVSWTSGDSGAGVAFVNVYMSTDGGSPAEWKVAAPATGSATFQAEVGHEYTFTAVATDFAGNATPLASVPSATTSTKPVTPGPEPTTEPTPQPSPPVTQTVQAPVRKAKRGARVSLARTTSAGQTVRWKSGTPNVCKVRKYTARMVKKGRCKVTATAAGNASTLALRRTFTIRVK